MTDCSLLSQVCSGSFTSVAEGIAILHSLFRGRNTETFIQPPDFDELVVYPNPHNCLAANVLCFQSILSEGMKSRFINRAVPKVYLSFHINSEEDILLEESEESAVSEVAAVKTSPCSCVESSIEYQPSTIDGEYVHNYQLKYIDQFWRNYAKQGVGRVAYGHFIDNHEGSGEVIQTTDQGFHDFIANLRHDGHLDNTILVLVADHGQHMGPYFFTKAGNLEHRLPLLTMVFPTPFLRRYPDAFAALRHNVQSLITPWDVYKTLRHFAHYPNQPPEDENFPSGPPWGQSILTEIAYNRSCFDAHIPAFRCVCSMWG